MQQTITKTYQTKSSSQSSLASGGGVSAVSSTGEPQGRPSNIAVRNFMINRADPMTRTRASQVLSSSTMRSAPAMTGLSAGVATRLSQAGITGFRGERQKEKQEMKTLNERLAGYIEKVHYLSAENQRLEAENEALRNRKSEDLQPIRDAYENELTQARRVIDELSAKDGIAEAKVAGLQDELARLRDLIKTYEAQAQDYRTKMAALDATIGDLEGELAALRARFGSRDDENDKQREIINKLKDQLQTMRDNLDSETAAHIQSECMAQTKAEEAAFYKDLLDQLELMKPEPIKIKGMDAAEFWQSHMKKAIRDIQTACDEKVNMLQSECEAKFESQVAAMQAGAVKDNLQLASSKEEVTKLRGTLADLRNANAQLQQRLASLQAERDSLAQQLAHMETSQDEIRLKYEAQIQALESELAGVMEQLKVLMDAKLSMELEIACYKKLLDGEETSFRSFGGSSASLSGGGSLASAIHSQTINLSNTSMSQSQLASTEVLGRMQVQKSSKGPVEISGIDHAGGLVEVQNDGSGAQPKSFNLGGWRLTKMVNNRITQDITLKEHDLEPHSTFNIYAKGKKQEATADNEQVVDSFSFGVGNCIWTLFDVAGDEKSSLAATFMSG